MNCPYCGSRLTMKKKNRCERCGEDVAVFKKIFRMANRYYNMGLERAKVRDLSGAVAALKNCLKLDKMHIDARNLLGLVYYEMGETVQALSEWVISKNFQEADNPAENYIKEVQDNPAKLEEANQASRRYNGALQAARQGSDDLAIIQLKKAIQLNPRHIRSLQLLGLLYINNGDLDRAKKCLARAARIDVSNTTTLSYLEEIRRQRMTDGKEQGEGQREENRGPVAIKDRDVITPIHTYAEQKPNIMIWINLVLGVIIGVAFFWLLFSPGIRKKAVADNQAQVISLNEQLVEKDAEMESLKKEVASLEQDMKEMSYHLNQESMEGPITDTARGSYESLIQAVTYYMNDQLPEAAEALLGVIPSDLTTDTSVALFEKLTGQLYTGQSQQVYQQGHDMYTSGDYEAAMELFDKALQMDQDNVDAIYFMGRSLQRLGNNDSAKLWYSRLVEDYAGTPRAEEAAERLAEIE